MKRCLTLMMVFGGVVIATASTAAKRPWTAAGLCDSNTTEAHILLQLDDGARSILGSDLLSQRITILVTKVLVDRFDPGASRALCSGDLILSHVGSKAGINAGRIHYSVAAYTDGSGIEVLMVGDDAETMRLLAATKAALGRVSN